MDFKEEMVRSGMIMTKTIEHIKDRIQFYKTSKANYAKECIKHPNNKTFEEAEKLCEELIQINEQIKCELEAWEVVKKHLILDKEFHRIDLHLHHDTIYKEDYLKLKKALEGKNE